VLLPIIPKNLHDAELVLRAAGFTHASLYAQGEDANEAVFMVDRTELGADSDNSVTVELMRVLPGFKVWLAAHEADVPSVFIF